MAKHSKYPQDPLNQGGQAGDYNPNYDPYAQPLNQQPQFAAHMAQRPQYPVDMQQAQYWAPANPQASMPFQPIPQQMPQASVPFQPIPQQQMPQYAQPQYSAPFQPVGQGYPQYSTPFEPVGRHSAHATGAYQPIPQQAMPVQQMPQHSASFAPVPQVNPQDYMQQQGNQAYYAAQPVMQQQMQPQQAMQGQQSMQQQTPQQIPTQQPTQQQVQQQQPTRPSNTAAQRAASEQSATKQQAPTQSAAQSPQTQSQGSGLPPTINWEEVEEERKKRKKRGCIIFFIILIVLALIGFGAYWWYTHIYNMPSNNDEITKISDFDAQAYVNEKVAESEININYSPTAIFGSDGKTSTSFTVRNIENNKAPIKFEIFDENGKSIYTSPQIDRGYEMKGITLSEPLSVGSHKGSIIISYVDRGNVSSSFPLTLEVG